MYTLISLTDSDKHFDSAITEYHKRLWKDLTFVNLKPSKVQNREQAIQADTEQLIKRIKKHENKYDHFILLSLNSKSKSTKDRVRAFSFWKRYCFIIWWPHGINEELIMKNWKLSLLGLGKQTMVHGLAKLVVTEQIYRIWMIQHNRSYHY